MRPLARPPAATRAPTTHRYVPPLPSPPGLEEGDEFDLDSVFEEIEAGDVVGGEFEGEDEELGMGSTFFENKLIGEVVGEYTATTSCYFL